MKKYAFLVHPSDYDAFLEGVREVGVLHVQEKNPEPTAEAVRKRLMYREVSGVIQQLKKRRAGEGVTATEPAETDGLAIVRSVLDLNEELERNRHQMAALSKEAAYLEPWGDFSPELVERLKNEGGTEVRFFICPEKKFDPAWEGRLMLVTINSIAPDRYFVVLAQEGEVLGLAAEELPAPRVSLSELRQKKAALEAAIEEAGRQLDRYAVQYLPLLEKNLLEIGDALDMEVAAGQSAPEAEGSVRLLEGFVPATKERSLLDFCEKTGTVHLAAKSRPKDNPPILLKNNRYASLFEPIGKLFALPAYAEMDLTPFFAPFFMMFFGFCLGDAGYGIVMLLGATIYKFKAKEAMKPIISLVQWLALATIVFGILTGTFFGVNLLQDQFAWLGPVRAFMLNSDQTFQFALILGLVQILFGLVLKTVNLTRQYGIKYALTPVGWFILLVSLVDIGVLKMALPVTVWTAWTGVGVILLFNDPEAGLFGRLGKGLWELYGISGFFGDLLSYIRLFALGLSSAILGFVVNDISLRVLNGVPYAGPVLFVLLLLVGHTANLLIAALGSFVHPLRLTFVEFYKNAGFAGGGKAYKPLEKKGE